MHCTVFDLQLVSIVAAVHYARITSHGKNFNAISGTNKLRNKSSNFKEHSSNQYHFRSHFWKFETQRQLHFPTYILEQ